MDQKGRETLINQNVTSHDQSGGITAHTVNQAPPPELRQLDDVKTTVSADGVHTVSVLIEVVAPYPPGNLSLEAHAASITDMNVTAQRTGATMFGHTGKREGFCFTNIQNPFGRYLVTVRTVNKEQIDFRYAFQ